MELMELETHQMEVGKFYLGVGRSEQGFVYYMTEMIREERGSDEDRTSWAIGFRVEYGGGMMAGVCPGGKGRWVEIDEEKFKEVALANFTRKLDKLKASVAQLDRAPLS